MMKIPNFAHAFRECAYRADTGLLWGVQIACIATAYCFATLNGPSSLPQTALDLLYTTIFATVAAVCALMLVIGSRRIAIRR